MTAIEIRLLFECYPNQGMKMKKIITLLTVIGLFALIGTPDAKAQNFTAPYQLFSNSAEAAGFGEAYSTLANDASAAFWNPAGLAQMESFSFTGVSATALQHDRHFSAANVAYHVDGIGTVAFGVTQSGVKDIQRRDDQGMHTGNFDNTNLVFGLSYARMITENVSVGITGRFINQDLHVQVDNGYSADAGVRYDQDLFSVGVVFQSLVGKVGPDDLPPSFRLGASLRPTGGLITSADLVLDDIGDPNARRYANFGAGYEVEFNDIILIPRAGLHDGAPAFGGGIGFGLNNMIIRVDYAFVNEPSDFFGTSHMIGLVIHGL